jgi:hypothetical protein
MAEQPGHRRDRWRRRPSAVSTSLLRRTRPIMLQGSIQRLRETTNECDNELNSLGPLPSPGVAGDASDGAHRRLT